MSDIKKEEILIADLMWSVRKFTRSSLMLQHVIAQHMNLHVTDAECIDYLQEMGPSTAGALAKATFLTTGAITSVIDRLEKSGFVKRSADPGDRRKVIVSFVPDRHTNTKQHYGDLAADIKKLFSGYDEQELRLMINYTQALTEVYQQNMLKFKDD